MNANEIMILFLRCQLRIEKARLESQQKWSLNSERIQDSEITKAVIDEIKSVLKELQG